VTERFGGVRDVHPNPQFSERAPCAEVPALAKRSQSDKKTCATTAYGEKEASVGFCFHWVCIRTGSSEKASSKITVKIKA
jgi:hypothetical protein